MEKKLYNHHHHTSNHNPYDAYHKQNSSSALTAPSTDSSATTPPLPCCCKCLQSRPKVKNFLSGLFTNLGICVVLFGYTVIGSFLFLAIEGGGRGNVIKVAGKDGGGYNASETLAKWTSENRERTVETIWDITVSLNILYRDNWTRLAALEISRFQDDLIRKVLEDIGQRPITTKELFPQQQQNHDWTFAKAFLYSLTVLTTIGYGSMSPRTDLGRAATMAYALLGIPLTLVYLSSVGSLLSRIARGAFSRALCCCLCSNCGYCCYDEQMMEEKERRMRQKRQQMELALQQEPYYVRSTSLEGGRDESPSLESSQASMHGLSILAPIFLCLGVMMGYIAFGAFALFRLENWRLLDGAYFCFMSLTTIGFGDLHPGLLAISQAQSDAVVWFCSVYIMGGMALTAMSFNVVHDEIVHQLGHKRGDGEGEGA